VDARDVFPLAVQESFVETVSLLSQRDRHASCALARLADQRVGDKKRNEEAVG